jgi:hypothetical protein
MLGGCEWLLSMHTFQPESDAPRLDDGPRRDASADSRTVGVTLLGASSTAASGVTTTLSLSQAVVSGSLVIVQVAARGNPPVTVSDSKNNTWSTAIELVNADNTATSGIYYSTLTSSFVPGDVITATLSGGANTHARAIGAMVADGLAALDQVGSAQLRATSTPSASTMSAVTARTELVVGATATGWMNADTLTPDTGFTQVYQYGTGGSSGSLDYELSMTLSGVQTYGTTQTQASAYCAVSVATFK